MAGAPQRQGEQQGHGRREQQRRVVRRAHALGEEPGALVRGGLALERLRQPRALPLGRGEGLERPHVGDHVDQLAADRPALARVLAVQGGAAQAERDHHAGGDDGKARDGGGQAPVDGREDDQGADEVHDRRRHFPGQPVAQGAEVAGHGGDAVPQRPGQLVLEPAHGMAGDVLEQVGADVDARADGHLGPDPAGNAPQHRLRRDQAQEQQQGVLHAVTAAGAGQSVDEEFHRVLHAHRAGGRAGHQHQQRPEGGSARHEVVGEEGGGAAELPGSPARRARACVRTDGLRREVDGERRGERHAGTGGLEVTRD